MGGKRHLYWKGRAITQQEAGLLLGQAYSMSPDDAYEKFMSIATQVLRVEPSLTSYVDKNACVMYVR